MLKFATDSRSARCCATEVDLPTHNRTLNIFLLAFSLLLSSSKNNVGVSLLSFATSVGAGHKAQGSLVVGFVIYQRWHGFGRTQHFQAFH